jgi:hypothetical protein
MATVEPPEIPTVCRRAKHGDVPEHRIIVLPDEVTASGFFRPTLPVVLCAHCDGGAHLAAIREHDKRKPV